MEWQLDTTGISGLLNRPALFDNTRSLSIVRSSMMLSIPPLAPQKPFPALYNIPGPADAELVSRTNRRDIFFWPL